MQITLQSLPLKDVRFNLSCTTLHVSSSSSSGPEAYAPDALQPVGLLCDPVLDVPTFAARCLHVETTREILAAKGETVVGNFA